ncbi:MAG: tetratricopeptide repeat protein [Candidatus Marinimicrobia bacterium]|nr:tetratricopeptide repeat protein [Candidatus Neomarinimicrobiota bacterium]MBL7011191.1 tetratricopeptide repeat protein [Candidatus Neomarinimicrobiota bacterium]
MKKIIMTLITTMTFGISQSVDDLIISGKEKIENAIQSWNEQELLGARAHFERVLSLNDKSWLIHYYIAYCDNQLVNYSMSKQEKAKVKKYVNDGLDHLEEALEENPGFAEAYAMMSSLYGTKISVMPWAGFWYGPKSGKLMGKAMAMEPNNPRINLTNGISMKFTPEAFGGGVASAKLYLNKAAKLFEHDSPESIMPDWGHSDVYAWLGLIEMEAGNNEDAKTYFERALEINPKNNWVKNQLMPKIE